MEIKIKRRTVTDSKKPAKRQVAQALLDQGYVPDTDMFGKSEYEHQEEAERKGWAYYD